MGDQGVLKTRRNIIPLIICVHIFAGVLSLPALAQAPQFSPELRTNHVKSADTRGVPNSPVSIDDSTRQYFFFELMGASEPWVPTVNGVRLFYDTTEHRVKWKFPWGGTRYADSMGVPGVGVDTALFAFLADSAGKVEWANILNVPALGDSVRAAWKADSAGTTPWAGITGKPATFAPSAHTHLKVDITDFPDSLRAAYQADTAAVAGAVSWAHVTGKPTLLVPGDTTTFRQNSDYNYQPKGTYLVPGDSTLQRTYSNYLYQAKGTYLIPGDSTEMRSYSNALYEPNVNLAANKAVLSDLSGNLTASANVSNTEVEYLDGVTSPIQTQLNGKEPTISLTANKAVISTAGGGLTASATTATQVGYLSNTTSDVQTQIDGKQPLDADLTTIAGLTATTDNFIVSVASAWASRTPAQVKTTLALNNVENTALSTWAGSANITTLGTIGTGTWNATAIGATKGGTGQTTVAQGDLLYGSAADTWSKLAKNTSATRYLSNTGTSNNPAWAQVDLSNGVTGTLPKANGGTGSTAPKDTIVKAFGFYNVSAADSALLLVVPTGAATWTVRDVQAQRVGGTAATINIRNVTDAVGIIDNYATTTSMAQADATINNPSLSAGDVLRVELISITGTVQELFVEMVIEVPE